MTGQTDWLSALAILGAGLILGVMFIYFFRGRRSAQQTTTDSIEQRDLFAKRDALIRQLRELEDTTKSTPEQLAEERTRLELETAQVLRDIDRIAGAKPAPPSALNVPAPVNAANKIAVNPRNAAMIGFAWGVGSILALGLLWYFVSKAASPREPEQMQAGSMQQPQQGQPGQPDAALQQLEAMVKSQPENLELRVDLAQAYLERENLMGTFDNTQFVLAKQPDHARAMTYQALVRLAMGEGKEAAAMLERATKKEPTLLDAWVALAWVHTQEGRPKEAEKAMQEAMRRRPDEKARLQDVLNQMQAKGMEKNAPAQTAAGQLPAGHPPLPGVGAEPATPMPVAAGGQSVRITLDLDAAARGRASQGGVLYVIARPAGVMGGPPVAVKRVAPVSFPLTFDLSSADSMMGQPLPASMRVEARLDSDGDAATKNPNDPYVAQDKVVPGTAITLAMK
ncbi:MAG: tetratricopeptide repeat protein [Thermoanaerobaculia bacterium]|nr:tetratricopeptide repeat protein [Thermoanaerobaculia bacterium]